MTRMGGVFCAATLLFGTFVHGQEQSIIQQEINRRAENTTLAQELLVQGDKFYKTAKYKEAVEKYREAFGLIPNAGLTKELRFATADRYAKAVVEHGKVLARTGQYEKAREQLEDVLKEDVAPGNAGAMKLLAQLDDPKRYSPTLTPEHVRNIEKAAKWLRKGESYFMQAQYDEALVAYEEVLKIDPYNQAARRGMQRIPQMIGEYAKSMKDEYRSRALMDVDEMWELKVRPEGEDAIVGEITTEGIVPEQEIKGTQLNKLIVPVVDFQNISLEEAVRRVRILSRELDINQLDQRKRGVNFVMRLGNEGGGFAPKIRQKKVNLKLRNVPLSTVLDYVCQQTGTYWKHERYAIIIRPEGTDAEDLETRTFRVSPSFLENAGGDEEESDNPFGGSTSAPKVIGAKEFLESLGVPFGEGASASYIKASNTLTVTNTPQYLDAIDDYVRAQALQEKVQVVIRVTFLDVAQNNLEELGYDWLIEPTQTKINGLLLGGGTQGSGDLVIPTQGSGFPTPLDADPVTSGLRSGESMFPDDALDRRIAGIDVQNAASQLGGALRAPGPLQVTGSLNDARFQTILRAISQKEDVSDIRVPSVVTEPGYKARVYSGQEFFYAEEFERGDIPNGGGGIPTPTIPSSITSTELGMLMDVEPSVSPDRQTITLQVNPTLRRFDGYVNYGNPLQTVTQDPLTGLLIPSVVSSNAILQPVFSNIRTDTRVTIQDGATVVIGGLLQQRIDKVEDKVPLLGDLPIIGRYFKSEGLRNNRRAVVIFLKAELVDPTGRPWRNR